MIGFNSRRTQSGQCVRAYASIAWAQMINVQIFRSVREGNESKLRRCHSACPYGKSASEKGRPHLQRGIPLGSATERLWFVSDIRWTFDSFEMSACILINESGMFHRRTLAFVYVVDATRVTARLVLHVRLRRSLEVWCTVQPCHPSTLVCP